MYSSQIKFEILAHKGSQTTRATPGDYLASWNHKPIGRWDLLASMKSDQDFAQWSVDKDDAKAKEKPAAKMEKP